MLLRVFAAPVPCRRVIGGLRTRQEPNPEPIRLAPRRSESSLWIFGLASWIISTHSTRLIPSRRGRQDEHPAKQTAARRAVATHFRSVVQPSLSHGIWLRIHPPPPSHQPLAPPSNLSITAFNAAQTDFARAPSRCPRSIRPSIALFRTVPEQRQKLV